VALIHLINKCMKTLHELYHKRSLRMSEISHLDLTLLPPNITNLKSARQIVWHLYHQIYNIPSCKHPNCSENAKWHRSYYGKFCSKKCSASDPSTITKAQTTIINRYGSHKPLIEKSAAKRKQTNLERYGVENPWGNKSVREKITATNLERYDVENAGGTEISQLKAQHTKQEKYGDKFYNNRHQAKKTNLERYGTEHASQCDRVKEKTANTFNTKHDGIFHNSPSISEKIKNTKLEKYNDESYSNREKAIQTNLEKYGHSNVMNCPAIKLSHTNKMNEDDVKCRRAKTMIERYGVSNFQYMHIAHDDIAVLTNRKSFIDFCNNKTISEISSLLNVHPSTIYNKIINFDCKDDVNIVKDHSLFEIQIANFLTSLDVKFIQNTRQEIKPYELDFYLPDYNIAIECNGDYWHSDIFKSRKYHYNKWQKCVDAGIHLLSLGESDWYMNNELFKNLIKSKLHLVNTSVGARNCVIKRVNTNEVSQFVNKHHLQGHAIGTHTYAAYDKQNNLVGVMIFGWTRGSKQSRRFELKRWVTIPNVKFPGLFSKIFKFAQNDIGFKEVISFSDNRWFAGDVYHLNNFECIKTHHPNYYYVLNGKSYHKQMFMKSNIKKNFNFLAESIDNGMTELEATRELGALKIWDCGKIEWKWSL